MPVHVPTRIAGPTAAASGDNTAYTPNEGQHAIITRVKLVNNGASKVTVKVGIGSSSDSALIFPAVGVPAKGMVDQETYDVLTDADSLIVNASATGVTYTVTGQIRMPTV